ncbi:MAG: LuxR C-terminal-related transcriptional regulator, partial [Paenibacillus sp.]
ALVYAAAVPRYFDQDLLQGMLGAPFPGEAFDGLLKLSFVRLAGRGWEMHELARSLICRSLRERQPDTYSDYRSRAAEVLSTRIRTRTSGGKDAAREVHELISLAGNPILRAHFRFSRNSRNYWEAVRPQTVEEVKQYLGQRRADDRTYQISCSDLETGGLFQYELSAKESVYRLEGWEPESLLALDQDALRLLRNPEGDVVGLAAMLPIRADTAEYLLRHPVSGPYFKARPEELRSGISYEKSGAKFVFAIDVLDPEQIELRSDTVNLMMEYIHAGMLLIASPPALPFYLDSHRSLGFTRVPDLPEIYRFGGRTEAAYFRLDTRGRRWAAYLEQIADYRTPADRGGSDDAPDEEQPDRARFGFTPREWEVADVLATGASNKEIAARLFISEAAVKKHINAMLQKTGFRNRTQIVMAVLRSTPSG